MKRAEFRAFEIINIIYQGEIDNDSASKIALSAYQAYERAISDLQQLVSGVN